MNESDLIVKIILTVMKIESSSYAFHQINLK
jgi:hypothetical protein